MQRESRRQRGHIGIRIECRVPRRSRIAIPLGSDIVQRQNRTPLVNSDPLQNPGGVYADIETLEEGIVDNVFRMEVACAVYVQG